MITIWIADNQDKIKEMLAEMIYKEGNGRLLISKQENIIRVAKEDEIKVMVSLKDKIAELEDILYRQNSGKVYKAMLEVIEKLLFELILERTEGNQLKAAKLLGINRNTMRSKVKKLGINVEKWKAAARI